MQTEIVCPYCKKNFRVEVVVKHNPFIEGKPVVSEVGISRYIKQKE